MKIELYTIIYNEEDLLPFFIDHYRKFVSKFIFYDNFSTDNSIKIIENSGINFEIKTYESNDKQDDFIFTDIKNNAWKESKNKNIDYVIVCDMDEFLYHEDINKFLENKYKIGVTIFKPEGFNMYSAEFPEYTAEKVITDQVKTGCRFEMLDKCVIFSPDNINDISYSMGCHFCSPTGKIRESMYDGLKLLHYKGLSLKYLLFKVHRSKSRIPEVNRKQGIARHYFYEDIEITNAFNEYLNKSKEII